MPDATRGDPKECPHCKSSSFFHNRTVAHQYLLTDTRQITIDRNYFCNNCKKYFFTIEKTTVGTNLYKSCKHPKLERSTNFLNFPNTSHTFFMVSLCLDCGAYLLTCEDIKNNLEEVWLNFWDYSQFSPFLYHPLICDYCSGQSFEDTTLEIYHANSRALALLKKEDNNLFKFFFGGKDSGIAYLEKRLERLSLEIANEKEGLEKERTGYLEVKFNWIIKALTPKMIEPTVDQRKKIYKEIGDKEKEFYQYVRKARNYYREKFNLPKIGEGWISETKLFELVKRYFKDYKVYFHYRQSWLNGLELDIFVPDRNLAIEYMGKQHYEPVNFFGGEKSHISTIQRDRLKKELCDKRGVSLIYFDYQTEVTKDNLKLALENYERNN